jgi:hypothetical protein
MYIYSIGSVTSIEATEVRADLNNLREASMKKIDAIYADTLAYANNAFPDAEAKSHYQALKVKCVFDLCRSEVHIYINDICIKFLSRVTVAHSIPAQSFSMKNAKIP